jgi:uncharacterized membrane protein
MTCITVASWMMSVVGVVILGVSLYCIYKDFRGDDLPFILVPACCMGVALGILVFCIGITPYIPEVTLPCITIIP